MTELNNNVEPQLLIECWLEEYKSIRSEIEHHLSSMRLLFILNLTASAAIYSFSFTVFHSAQLVWLIPILSSILGLIFLSHCIRVSNLNDHIDDDLVPKIQKICNDPSAFGWTNRRTRKRWYYRLLSLDGIRLLTFIVIGVIGVMASIINEYVNPETISENPVTNALFSPAGKVIVFGGLLVLFLIVLAISSRDSWSKNQ